MREVRGPRQPLLIILGVFLACGARQTPSSGEPVKSPVKQEPGAIEAYRYPPPVKGHYAEANIGEFDLVDGLAYKASSGTVVHATSKPIASPLLSDECPMSEARAITALRNARWLEVTLDAKGRSDYFGSGTPFDGTSREQESGGRYWTSHVDLRGGKAVGEVKYKGHGGFEFDLPLRQPSRPQVSESDQFSALRGDPNAPQPSDAALKSAYQAIHQAILAKDLAAALAAQGYSSKLIAALRGLDGIDDDLAIFADRFLEPGTADETQPEAGYGSVGASGKNSKGNAFINYYQFESCGDRLILVGVGENPQ
jgi:hypothetical protein